MVTFWPRSVRALTARENSPVSERRAARAALSVPLPIKSTTASAWVRSSLPLRNARRENSPGSACRAPDAITASTSIDITTGPP